MVAGSGPRQRVDARRNAQSLLRSAREAFAEGGVGVPAKVITDRAGLGVGTLYRHFPRRSDLIVAVLQQELDACVAAAGELASSLGPGQALAAWLARFAGLVATKAGLAAALHSGDPAYAGLPQRLLDQLEPALSVLLERARDVAVAVDGAGAREVLVAVALLCQPLPGEPAGAVERRVSTYTDGLTPPRARATPDATG